MENYNIRTSIIIIIFAFILSGCPINNGANEQINEGYGFINAKIYPLATNSNSIYIYENEQKTIFTAELQNEMFKGAKNVKLLADNYNSAAIDLSELNNYILPDFDDYDAETRMKHVQILEIPSIPVNTIQNRPYSSNIRFHLCADAITFLETQICVGPQNTINARQGTCTPGTVTLSKGQGAPIAITSIQQIDTGNSITLHIKAVNKAKGVAYKPQSEDKCGFISQDDVGIINILYARLSGIEMTCEPTTERLGYTQQYQASAGATFVCMLMKSELGMDPEAGSRPHILQVELDYRYYQELPSQNIIIKNAPGYVSP